ncbi:MAG: MAPEG family protein, partial [Candidatus Binataceae bacterium]
GVLVSAVRARTGVAAPATTGDPLFERYFRVHQNTLEALIVFLPGLWLFAHYVNLPAAVILGAIFIVVRIVYAVGYIRAAEQRAIGAVATGVINAILMVGSLVGLIVFAVT